MNKPSKSKAAHKQCFRFDCHQHGLDNRRLRDAIFGTPDPGIIARMEAAQQRFNPFPSLLVSAENERRLQLNDCPDWVRDGDPPAIAGESEAEYNERTGRYE